MSVGRFVLANAGLCFVDQPDFFYVINLTCLQGCTDLQSLTMCVSHGDMLAFV